jgi:hypothetical protein
VRYQFRTTEGEIIYIQATGSSTKPGSVEQPPTELYMRPKFETGAEKYYFMNYITTVGLIKLQGSNATISIWEVRQWYRLAPQEPC